MFTGLQKGYTMAHCIRDGVDASHFCAELWIQERQQWQEHRLHPRPRCNKVVFAEEQAG
jgi:hypothetical protein